MYFVFSVPVSASASVAFCTSHLFVVSAHAVIFLLPVPGRYIINSSVVFGVTNVCPAMSTDGFFRDGAVVGPLLSNTCPVVQKGINVSTQEPFVWIILCAVSPVLVAPALFSLSASILVTSSCISSIILDVTNNDTKSQAENDTAVLPSYHLVTVRVSPLLDVHRAFSLLATDPSVISWIVIIKLLVGNKDPHQSSVILVVLDVIDVKRVLCALSFVLNFRKVIID
jgi:hypothetical protein